MRTKRPRSWGRHAWILPALGAVLWLAAIVWPRMVAMEPSPFVQLRPEFPLHYPIIFSHAVTGNIAMLTACLQIWPWLRERHPAVHRASGRIYVSVTWNLAAC